MFRSCYEIEDEPSFPCKPIDAFEVVTTLHVSDDCVGIPTGGLDDPGFDPLLISAPLPGQLYSDQVLLTGDSASLLRVSDRWQSPLRFSDQRQRCCHSVAVALTRSRAAVVGSLADGRVRVHVSLSEHCEVKTSIDWEAFRHEDIGCLSIDSASLAAFEAEAGASSRASSSTRRLRCAAGTSGGVAAVVELGGGSLHVDRQCSWRAHSARTGGFLSGISSLAMAGTCIVTGGADSDACIWLDAIGNRAVPSQARMLPGVNGGAVTAVACATAPMAPSALFSGLLLETAAGEAWHAATGGEDGAVQFWTSSSAHAWPLRQHSDTGKHGRGSGAVTHLALDGKHSRMCVACEDSSARVWDLAVGRATRRFAHHTLPMASSPFRTHAQGGSSHSTSSCGPLVVAFDSEEATSHLATGGLDGSWCLWDLRQREKQPVVHQHRAHCAPVAAIVLLGQRLLSAGSDGHAALCDLRYMPVPVLSRPYEPDLICHAATLPVLWEARLFGEPPRRPVEELAAKPPSFARYGLTAFCRSGGQLCASAGHERELEISEELTEEPSEWFAGHSALPIHASQGNAVLDKR
mmetsp:Transcript_160533/g.515308  ORF Transcript_160533/g.515308 Transcript_160533/m.515308 type:complete len:577 (-) Transcript_160533:50-1780(-)